MNRAAVVEAGDGDENGSVSDDGWAGRFPTRPMNAYNLFFRDERARCMQDLLEASSSTTTSRQIDFSLLAKTIASRWKTLDDTTRAVYTTTAAEKKNLYDAAVRVWRIHQQQQEEATEQVETL
jgi:HMG (high mobility group) box